MATGFTLAHRVDLNETLAGSGPATYLPDWRFDVNVVRTDDSGTQAALNEAAALARGLDARIRLIAPIAVPYRQPLETPPVPASFYESKLGEAARRVGVDARVEIYLCRDTDALLSAVLPHRAVVVLGGRRRWWPTREEALARRLRRLGHEVIFVDSAKGKAESTVEVKEQCLT